MQPLPNLRCPLCGGPNDCAPARCGRFDVDCWCSRATVSREALARVPEAQRNQACLCPRCAAGPQVPRGE
ncbi:cysteine-rich CWC family protein [Ideonella sp. BN130291]|uniref:cysteine-rich CWC family protein n=1 Tax=Ideonella sp. BN130291 TaxID=3112940 RepID=UPI002E26956E|nr:cysteine-rich CWC family protein [Ideonella sp. BN130291]